MDTLPEFLTVKEVGQALRLSSMSVYRLLHLNEIGYVKAGKSFRIPRQELEDYIKRRLVERTP
jgi:excisionase family DNA binding protein